MKLPHTKTWSFALTCFMLRVMNLFAKFTPLFTTSITATVALYLIFQSTAFAVSVSHEIDAAEYSESNSSYTALPYAAMDHHVAQAPCKTTKPITLEEIKKYLLQRAATSEKTSLTLKGITLQNEAKVLVNALQKLITNQEVINGFEYGTPTPFKVTFTTKCTKVICAATQIWGEELGLKLIYIFLKYGFNASEYAFSDADRLHLDEMNDILMALNDLPKNVTQYFKNQQLSRYSRGYTLAMYKNDAVLANARIHLFDLWSEKSSMERNQTLVHEIGHNMEDLLGLEAQWKLLAGWKSTSTSSGCMISQYGETNSAEDFAETFTMYRYRADALKALCPKKYAFMKDKVFKGKEYTSVASCTGISQDLIDQAAFEILNSSSSQSIDFEQITSLAQKQCAQQPNRDALVACIRSAIQQVPVTLTDIPLSTEVEKNSFAKEEAKKQASRMFMEKIQLTPEQLGLVSDAELVFNGASRDDVWKSLFVDFTAPVLSEIFREIGYESHGITFKVSRLTDHACFTISQDGVALSMKKLGLISFEMNSYCSNDSEKQKKAASAFIRLVNQRAKP